MNNKADIINSISGVTKTYLRISSIKTALTFALVAYTGYQVVKTLKQQLI